MPMKFLPVRKSEEALSKKEAELSHLTDAADNLHQHDPKPRLSNLVIRGKTAIMKQGSSARATIHAKRSGNASREALRAEAAQKSPANHFGPHNNKIIDLVSSDEEGKGNRNSHRRIRVFSGRVNNTPDSPSRVSQDPTRNKQQPQIQDENIASDNRRHAIYRQRSFHSGHSPHVGLVDQNHDLVPEYLGDLIRQRGINDMNQFEKREYAFGLGGYPQRDAISKDSVVDSNNMSIPKGVQQVASPHQTGYLPRSTSSAMASQIASPLDHRDAASNEAVLKVDTISQVVALLPDICRVYVAKLFDQNLNSAEAIINHVMEQVEAGKQYTKAEDMQKSLKRKRVINEEEEAVKKYGSMDRVENGLIYRTIT